MASSHSNLSTILLAGAGISALYYGLSLFNSSIKTLHNANKDEKSAFNQGLQEMSRMEFSDPSMQGASSLVKALAKQQEKSISGGRLYGVGCLIGAGLTFFTAYEAYNSFSTGKPMSKIVKLTAVGTTASMGYNIIKQI